MVKTNSVCPIYHELLKYVYNLGIWKIVPENFLTTQLTEIKWWVGKSFENQIKFLHALTSL